MAGETLLLNLDTLIVDGIAVPIEDSTGTIDGAARHENEVVLSASGDDYQKRKRVATVMNAKLQFGPSVDPMKFAKMTDVQITARDSKSGRRALMPRCSFASMGTIGSGSVDVKWNVLAPIQWL